MKYRLLIACYEPYYAKAVAWAGANSVEFEETRSYAGDRAVQLDLSDEQVQKLFNDLGIEKSPKVRLP